MAITRLGGVVDRPSQASTRSPYPRDSAPRPCLLRPTKIRDKTSTKVVLRVHPNSQLLFNKYAKTLFNSGFRVLEIGPDKLPTSFCEEVGDTSINWETLEYVSSEKFFTSDNL